MAIELLRYLQANDEAFELKQAPLQRLHCIQSVTRFGGLIINDLGQKPKSYGSALG